jgi:hypothetical protein
MVTTGIDLALPGLASDSFSVSRVIGHYTRVPRETSAQNPHRGSPSSVTVPPSHITDHGASVYPHT